MINIETYTITCKDTEEIITGTKYECYEKYLKTKHWKKLRKKIANIHSKTCQICLKTVKEGYHIHHLTYRNIGNEKIPDLMFLCESCHNDIHSGKIEQSKIDKILREKSYDISIPKNYIRSESYKNKSLFKKINYLCVCFKDNKHFTDEDKENLIKYMENLIFERFK